MCCKFSGLLDSGFRTVRSFRHRESNFFAIPKEGGKGGNASKVSVLPPRRRYRANWMDSLSPIRYFY